MTKEELKASIGESIKRYRKSQGLTQEELAEKAGISIPFCAQIEAGNRSMSVYVLYRIAAALDVGLDALVDGESRRVHENDIAEIFDSLTDEQIEFVADLLRLIQDKL